MHTRTTRKMLTTQLNDNEAQSRNGVSTLRGDCPRRRIAAKRLLKGLVLAVAMMFLHHDASAGGRTLNVVFKLDMVSTGVDTNASGKISGMLLRNGFISNQQLKLSVAHLDANTDYQVFAFIGDDANLRSVAQFTTDAKGAFTITYVQKCPGNTSRGGQPLPNVLDPISHIHQLDIVKDATVLLTGAI